jgi:hypothetical protein
MNKLYQGSRLMSDGSFTEPPQCMPDHCKVDGDAVKAYRQYYIMEKNKIAKWKHGNEPDWYKTGALFADMF